MLQSLKEGAITFKQLCKGVNTSPKSNSNKYLFYKIILEQGIILYLVPKPRLSWDSPIKWKFVDESRGSDWIQKDEEDEGPPPTGSGIPSFHPMDESIPEDDLPQPPDELSSGQNETTFRLIRNDRSTRDDNRSNMTQADDNLSMVENRIRSREKSVRRIESWSGEESLQTYQQLPSRDKEKHWSSVP